MKMVGYITTAHGSAQRLSEKWRHLVCTLISSLFCTSPRCVGVHKRQDGSHGGTAVHRGAVVRGDGDKLGESRVQQKTSRVQ